MDSSVSDVFVSYSAADREQVRPLVEALEKAGLKAWWDTRIALGAGFDYFVTRLESQDEELRGLLRTRNYGPKLYLSWIF